MDLTKLEHKTTESTSGGGYFGFRIALQDECEAIPMPSEENKAITADDFIFKNGKGFYPIYNEESELDLEEDPAEQVGSDAYTSKISAFFPGENTYIRQFVNEGYASKKMYVLIDNCEDMTTYLAGKGKCCAASMKAKFKSGKKASERKGWEVTVTVEGKGVMTKYEGVGAINRTFKVDANDSTPDVSRGTGTYLIAANSAATEITTLDNAVVGSLVTLKWTSDMNMSTIANGGAFHLTKDFTPVVGATLTLHVLAPGSFAERHRFVPVP